MPRGMRIILPDIGTATGSMNMKTLTESGRSMKKPPGWRRDVSMTDFMRRLWSCLGSWRRPKPGLAMAGRVFL